MKIKLTDQAVEWFKDELDLPENNKVLQFYSFTFAMVVNFNLNKVSVLPFALNQEKM